MTMTPICLSSNGESTTLQRCRSANNNTTTSSISGFPQSSSIVYRQRMIALRRAKSASCSSPSKDRVSPTSILGFPETIVDLGCEPNNFALESQSSVGDLPDLAVSSNGIVQNDLSSTVDSSPSLVSCQPITLCSSSLSISSSLRKASLKVDGDDEEASVYSDSLRNFVLLNEIEIEDSFSHTSSQCNEGIPTESLAAFGTATEDVPSVDRPTLREVHHLPAKTLVPTAIRRVVFNETMDVRYFTRSFEEIAIMKQCASERRLQQQTRRMRRRQMMNAFAANDDDDEGESNKCHVGYTYFEDTPVVADTSNEAFRRCGIAFQSLDEDVDDEDESQHPKFRFSGASRNNISRSEPLAIRGTSVLQTMVNNFTGMIHDAIGSGAKSYDEQPIRQPPKQEPISPPLSNSNLLDTDHRVSVNISHDPLFHLDDTTEHNAQGQCLNDKDDLFPNFVSCSNGTLSTTANPREIDPALVKEEEEDDVPWILVALHCGGGAKV